MSSKFDFPEKIAELRLTPVTVALHDCFSLPYGSVQCYYDKAVRLSS
ncbi:MAG TPA: hypothetical protein VGA80_06055 [Flavobacteriaceae bacterium]